MVNISNPDDLTEESMNAKLGIDSPPADGPAPTAQQTPMQNPPSTSGAGEPNESQPRMAASSTAGPFTLHSVPPSAFPHTDPPHSHADLPTPFTEFIPPPPHHNLSGDDSPPQPTNTSQAAVDGHDSRMESRDVRLDSRDTGVMPPLGAVAASRVGEGEMHVGGDPPVVPVESHPMLEADTQGETTQDRLGDDPTGHAQATEPTGYGGYPSAPPVASTDYADLPLRSSSRDPHVSPQTHLPADEQSFGLYPHETENPTLSSSPRRYPAPAATSGSAPEFSMRGISSEDFSPPRPRKTSSNFQARFDQFRALHRSPRSPPDSGSPTTSPNPNEYPDIQVTQPHADQSPNPQVPQGPPSPSSSRLRSGFARAFGRRKLSGQDGPSSSNPSSPQAGADGFEPPPPLPPKDLFPVIAYHPVDAVSFSPADSQLLTAPADVTGNQQTSSAPRDAIGDAEPQAPPSSFRPVTSLSPSPSAKLALAEVRDRTAKHEMEIQDRFRREILGSAPSANDPDSEDSIRLPYDDPEPTPPPSTSLDVPNGGAENTLNHQASIQSLGQSSRAVSSLEDPFPGGWEKADKREKQMAAAHSARVDPPIATTDAERVAEEGERERVEQAELNRARARAEQEAEGRRQTEQAEVARQAELAEQEKARLVAAEEARLVAAEEARLAAAEEARKAEAEQEKARLVAAEKARLVAAEEARRAQAEEEAERQRRRASVLQGVQRGKSEGGVMLKGVSRQTSVPPFGIYRAACSQGLAGSVYGARADMQHVTVQTLRSPTWRRRTFHLFPTELRLFKSDQASCPRLPDHHTGPHTAKCADGPGREAHHLHSPVCAHADRADIRGVAGPGEFQARLGLRGALPSPFVSVSFAQLVRALCVSP